MAGYHRGLARSAVKRRGVWPTGIAHVWGSGTNPPQNFRHHASVSGCGVCRVLLHEAHHCQVTDECLRERERERIVRIACQEVVISFIYCSMQEGYKSRATRSTKWNIHWEYQPHKEWWKIQNWRISVLSLSYFFIRDRYESRATRSVKKIHWEYQSPNSFPVIWFVFHIN